MAKPRRITVRGIIFKDNKLLAQQLLPSDDGIKKDYWCTPGGGLEEGESLHEGLHREMVEETGIAPKIGKLLFIQQYQDNEREFLEFFFHVENAEDYKVIDLESTSHGPLEIERVEFVVPHEHQVLPAFLQTVDLEKQLTTIQPVTIYDNFSE